jgi:hypothetical protein
MNPLRALFLALIPFVMAACADCPQVVPGANVQIQKVDVPVEVARVPPADVTGCWNSLPPPPKFTDAPGGLLLSLGQVKAYEDLISGVQACDQKWRTWATAAPPAQ